MLPGGSVQVKDGLRELTALVLSGDSCLSPDGGSIASAVVGESRKVVSDRSPSTLEESNALTSMDVGLEVQATNGTNNNLTAIRAAAERIREIRIIRCGVYFAFQLSSTSPRFRDSSSHLGVPIVPEVCVKSNTDLSDPDAPSRVAIDSPRL